MCPACVLTVCLCFWCRRLTRLVSSNGVRHAHAGCGAQDSSAQHIDCLVAHTAADLRTAIQNLSTPTIHSIVGILRCDVFM